MAKVQKKTEMAKAPARDPDELRLSEIGRRIRNQREALHYTREQLGDMIGVTGKFLADIEGGMKGMSIQTLNKLATCLHLSTDFILGRDSAMLGEDEAELRQIKENIMATLSICDADNLNCFDQMARYFIKGAVIRK